MKKKTYKIAGLLFLIVLLLALLGGAVYALMFQQYLPRFNFGDLVFGLYMLIFTPLVVGLLSYMLVSIIKEEGK